MPKTAVAIRHIHFEDLGIFEPVLTEAGYKITYCDLDTGDLAALDPLAPDLLIVLGGPVGVYEDDLYPYLMQERQLIERRLAAGLPTLGLCLGAQLMAAALGASVAPMGHKEIGFSALSLSEEGRAGPLLHLEGLSVLHWHGDAFEIPPGAVNIASTALCATQGFAIGANVLGLQFHPEVDAASGIERWLTGHASELASAGIDPRTLRQDAVRLGPALRSASRAMFREWVAGLSPDAQ